MLPQELRAFRQEGSDNFRSLQGKEQKVGGGGRELSS